MYKSFLSYVIPSVIAFALSGVYAIVDGFFIGNSIGDMGLAAINIAYPLTSLIQSLGTGIGMGGAIHYAIYKAAKRENEANRYFWLSLILLIVTTVVLMALYVPFSDDILRMFGAEGEMLTFCTDYMFYITLGTIFQMLGTGLVPFIRNMGGSYEAMISMIIGFIGNVGFDYLLVWVYPLGMKGAALATIIGQSFTMCCAIYFLFKRRHTLVTVWDIGYKHQITNIVKVGLSPFGVNIIPNTALIFINKSAIEVGGDLAVSSYAVISYIVCVVLLLLQGVSDGAQPLISTYYGEKEYKKCKITRNIAYLAVLIISIISNILIYYFRYELSLALGASIEVINDVANIIYIFLIGLPFAGISKITASYFYASEKNPFASFMIYLEPTILIVSVLTIPKFMGIIGTWSATPLSQILVTVVGFGLLCYASKTNYKVEKTYNP